MANRTTLIAATLLLVGSAVGAQVITPQPVGQDDQDLASPAEEQVTATYQRNPCRNNSSRCPDPTTLDKEPSLISSNLPAPDAKPAAPNRKVYVKRKLVLFQDGKFIQIKTYKRMRAGGNTWVAQPGDAPWMAQIQRPLYVRSVTARALQWDDRQFCGGAKIAPGWIVTAAHCLNDNGVDIRTGGYRVRLGMTDIRDGRVGASYKIVRVIQHPNYNRPTRYANDIALIQYASDAETARAAPSWIETIAIDPDRPGAKSYGGKEAWFYGWGVTNSQRPSALLRYGKIKLQPDTGCANHLIALCGRGEGARGSTQCHGDSGGPLIVHYGNVPVLVGLVSHNVGKQACGVNQKQGVYTRVASARDWIQGYTGRLPSAPTTIQRR
ncbi:MAG: serine protease [Novosphingobium sp.]|nr:serine protease [Novosphingobium sp.]MBP6554114.1 serine protease [Novosphingobium sp.]